MHASSLPPSLFYGETAFVSHCHTATAALELRSRRRLTKRCSEARRRGATFSEIVIPFAAAAAAAAVAVSRATIAMSE